MAWESWNSMYNRWLDALADRNIESFFKSSYENSREMRTTYSTIGNIKEFTAWLKSQADQETAGASDGEMFSCIGGC